MSTTTMPRWRAMLGSGVSLVAVTVIASTILRLGSSVVLTRLLSPEDFGAAAITAAILTVMLMISDLGFSVFIVQHADGDDPRFLDVVWTVRLVRSVILTILLAAVAEPFAQVIGKPALGLAIAVSSIHFLIEGVSSLALITEVRKQRLFVLSCVDVGTTAIQIILGVGLAVLLKSYWAIIVSGVLGALAKTWLSYSVFPGSRRRLAFDARIAADLWKLGRTIVGAHTIYVLLSQVDKFVLSRVFSLSVFGLYSISANLAGAPSAFTSIYPSRVLLPAYAATQRAEPAMLRDVYYDGRRVITLLYMAAMGVFIGFAPAIIHIVYDPRYASAGDYLRILAVAPLLGLNNYAAREVLIVVGRVETLLMANIVRLAWLLTAGIGGYWAFGAIGLIAAVGGIEVPVTVYNWWALHRSNLLRMDQEAIMLAIAALGAVAGYLAVPLALGAIS